MSNPSGSWRNSCIWTPTSSPWPRPPAGLPWPGDPQRRSDLAALRLDRLPASPDELRRAYRRAARAAHPDADGGSREGFLAVAGAFEHLSGAVAGRAA